VFGFVCFFYTEEDANEYARILDRDTIENIQIAGLKYYKKGKKSDSILMDSTLDGHCYFYSSLMMMVYISPAGSW
jgi:hypothetical protein